MPSVALTARHRCRLSCLPVLACCVSLCLAGLPSIGAAQAKAAQAHAAAAPPTAAVEHYELGRRHYLAGRYREARSELEAALALDPASPNLLYNLARVNENLGNLDVAISYYERYLKHLPKSETAEREQTEKTIRRLQGAKAELAATQANAAEWKSFGPSAAPAVSPQPPGRADALFWVTGSVGAGLVIAGGITGVVALQRQGEASDFVIGLDGTLAQRERIAGQADDFAFSSDVLFIAGSAALTSAVFLYFLRDPSSAHEPPIATLGLTPHGATVTTRIRM